MLEKVTKSIGCSLAAALCFSVAASGASQDSKSAPLARELAQVLDAQKVDSIAAADPQTGGFVAAIYIPGTQLLVVGGKFQSPEIGNYRLSKHEFRELYMDLTGGSDPASRMFASDVSANGLVLKPNGDAPADTWESGTTRHAFLGHKKAKLKEDEYERVFSQADEQYARLLSLLLAQAKPKTEARR